MMKVVFLSPVCGDSRLWWDPSGPRSGGMGILTLLDNPRGTRWNTPTREHTSCLKTTNVRPPDEFCAGRPRVAQLEHDYS